MDFGTIINLIDRLRDAAQKLQNAEILDLVRDTQIRMTDLVSEQAHLVVAKLEAETAYLELKKRFLHLEAEHARLAAKEAEREAQAEMVRQVTRGE